MHRSTRYWKPATKSSLFGWEGKHTNKHTSVNIKDQTYTHSLFYIKEFIYHKFTPHNDHALYLIVRTVYDCRVIKDNQTFHWESRLSITTINFPTQNPSVKEILPKKQTPVSATHCIHLLQSCVNHSMLPALNIFQISWRRNFMCCVKVPHRIKLKKKNPAAFKQDREWTNACMSADEWRGHWQGNILVTLSV